jgi:hypothetical protein
MGTQSGTNDLDVTPRIASQGRGSEHPTEPRPQGAISRAKTTI